MTLTSMHHSLSNCRSRGIDRQPQRTKDDVRVARSSDVGALWRCNRGWGRPAHKRLLGSLAGLLGSFGLHGLPIH